MRYSLTLTLVSGPHVNYSAPPSIGLGLGGFGWNAGGGAGIGFPLGNPHPTSVDDQFVASVRFGAPRDYMLHGPANSPPEADSIRHLRPVETATPGRRHRAVRRG
jgi:hypothetical protein